MTPLNPRQLAALYKPSAKAPVIVDVPPMRFLQLEGVGDIGGASFQEAVGALYGLAYPVKFAAKKSLGLTYKVAPLEGLYWHADGDADFDAERPRLALVAPDDHRSRTRSPASSSTRSARRSQPRRTRRAWPTSACRPSRRGASVQILHVGPYADETPTVERLFAFAEENGYDITGDHHEIYLGDPNRADPSKLKTVLRYGVRKSARIDRPRPRGTRMPEPTSPVTAVTTNPATPGRPDGPLRRRRSGAARGRRRSSTPARCASGRSPARCRRSRCSATSSTPTSSCATA